MTRHRRTRSTERGARIAATIAAVGAIVLAGAAPAHARTPDDCGHPSRPRRVFDLAFARHPCAPLFRNAVTMRMNNASVQLPQRSRKLATGVWRLAFGIGASSL
jgi:hypothetical protein